MRSFDATAAQKGLWLAENMAPETLNHALFMWDVDGELDAAAMASAFRHVLDEAEVLRVTFVDDGGDGLRQVARELGDWQSFFLDLSTEPDPPDAARAALADVVGRPFDLERDLLVRLGVIRLAPARSLVVIAYHHLVSDGYGAGGLFSRRLAEVYTALVRGTRVPELPRRWDVETLAAEEAAYRASPAFREDTDFWREYLAAPVPVARVPRVALSEPMRHAMSEPMSEADRWSPVAESIGMVSRTLSVARAEADEWAATARSLGVWMSSLLAAAAAVYFRHRLDQPEFHFSLAVGNRTGAMGTTPALAVNVVPLRARVSLDATFAQVADAMVDETYEISGHTACHYSEIQRAGGRGPTDRGSFGAVLNVVEFVEQPRFGDSPARYVGVTTGAFGELSIGIYSDGSADGDLLLRLDAPASLYSAGELGFMGAELLGYLRAVLAADAEQPIGTLNPVGVLDPVGEPASGSPPASVAGHRQQPTASGTPATAPAAPRRAPTVVDLFARQVERTPDAVAVVSADRSVTYRELDESSSRVAAALRRRRVEPETTVAVAMPRSADLVVALLAVVKAGGAYLAIDPTASAARIRSVAGGVPVGLLIADAGTADAPRAVLDVPAVSLDDLRGGGAGDDSRGGRDDLERGGDGTPVRSWPDALVTVLHGSGTDGTSTGVAVTHRNLAALVQDGRWREGARGAVLWQAPPDVDAFALQLWAPLVGGGRVVVAPPGELDADALVTARAAAQVHTVPLAADLLPTIAARRPACLADVREVWTGGDRVPAAAVERARAGCPELTIVTGFGPPETTGLAAGRRLTPDDPPVAAGDVGHPVDHVTLYVLGPGLVPVPPGVTGELYVAGPGVTRGYPGQSGRTATRFVPCPFGPRGARMYRTADRVRWAAGGGLEYMGPANGQIWIRGDTVEPAEVEEALAAHPDLAQAVVVARRDGAGEQRLVAYLVPAQSGAALGPDSSVAVAGPSSDDLRRFAAQRLTASAVPSVFVWVDRLPVAANGRVDQTSLPEPDFGHGTYRAPRNDTERTLARAFAEVLELERVSIDADFFDLGGNSLRAVRLVGLIRAELNLEVSIRTLFATRTIVGLSDKWEGLARSSRPALRRRTRAGALL
ncbi:AMP-binding protein [Frankia sp. AvcI1]|uniref:AMP-binding protein n=1 Tax=Frankia sp. AvcI1 TaxID=573496 RepID=UPI0021179829|nr:AMP-binding protein [Frankia sp. AvcI1]